MEPTSRGAAGSETSYCLSSPVPQQDTYSIRSSTDRSMSVTSGGTAENGLSAGGRSSGSAGSAGGVVTLSALPFSPSREQPPPHPGRAGGGEDDPHEPPGGARGGG